MCESTLVNHNSISTRELNIENEQTSCQGITTRLFPLYCSPSLKGVVILLIPTAPIPIYYRIVITNCSFEKKIVLSWREFVGAGGEKESVERQSPRLGSVKP